jgi:hypothetical protein
VIFLAIGFVLGFISSYMILKINELELRNKILEKQILEQQKNRGLDQNIPKEIKLEEKNNNDMDIKNEEEEKEPLKEYKDKEVNVAEEQKEVEEEKVEKEDNINNTEEIKEEPKPKKKQFVPYEIKERKIVEEDWTTVTKGKKKKKPQ